MSLKKLTSKSNLPIHIYYSHENYIVDKTFSVGKTSTGNNWAKKQNFESQIRSRM